jgi:hypothetical protein
MSQNRPRAEADRAVGAGGPADELLGAFCFYFQLMHRQGGGSPRPRKAVNRPLTGQAEMSPTNAENLFNLFAGCFQSARDAGQPA